MGCGWNPVCRVKKAASKAWDWLTGDGSAGWVRAILSIILIIAAAAIVLFLILGYMVFIEIAMIVVAVAFVSLVVYAIVKKKK